MRVIELWRWRMASPTTGKPYTTKHLLTEQDALAQDPKAKRIASSYERRELPEEPRQHSTGDFMGKPV